MSDVKELHKKLIEPKNINENRDVVKTSNVKDIYKKLKVEAVGDEKVANMIDDLSRCTDVEMLMFSTKLMDRNVKKFSAVYHDPMHEEFANSMAKVISRYQIMDSTEQGDLFEKIKLMFKDICSKNFNALGPDVADRMGEKYSENMIKYIKNQSPNANTDLYPDDTWF